MEEDGEGTLNECMCECVCVCVRGLKSGKDGKSYFINVASEVT